MNFPLPVFIRFQHVDFTFARNSNNNKKTSLGAPVSTLCMLNYVNFNVSFCLKLSFSWLPRLFWLSSFLVVFVFDPLRFWSSSFLVVVVVFGCLGFRSSSFLVVFVFGHLCFWSSSFLIVFHFG